MITWELKKNIITTKNNMKETKGENEKDKWIPVLYYKDFLIHINISGNQKKKDNWKQKSNNYRHNKKKI